MAFSVVIFKNTFSCIAVIVPFLICTGYVGSGFLPIFSTISFVILSSILFTFSKHKELLVKAPLEDEPLTYDNEFLPQMKEDTPKLHPEIDSFSESESINHSSITDHDSEFDWPCSVNPDCSDGSISDEESLIEIALPSGHYVEKFSDFSSESIFSQHGLKGIFADMNEMNEEDNLIEIDLSIGSIKCSRFEI